MARYPLTLDAGHLYARISDGDWLLDTGSPASFGREGNLTIDGRAFAIPPAAAGLDAGALAGMVGRPFHGLLGTNILNQFDVLFDVANGAVTLVSGDLEPGGPLLRVDQVMGIRVLELAVNGTPMRAFFDTGAQVSYVPEEVLQQFAPEGEVTDFYPGYGTFTTSVATVEFSLAECSYALRCGALPALLAMTLMLAGTTAIIGNELIRDRRAWYLPSRHALALAP